MAEIMTEAPVNYLSGKLSKKNCSIIYNHRTSRNFCYTSVRKKKPHRAKSAGSPVPPSQAAVQTKFTSVAKATRARLMDPTKKAADIAAFKKQSKYDTLYKYVFNQEWEEYEG